MSNEDETSQRVKIALGVLLTTVRKNNLQRWPTMRALFFTISDALSQAFSAAESLEFFAHLQEFSFLKRAQGEEELNDLNFLKDMGWGDFNGSLGVSLKSSEETFDLIARAFVEHSVDAGAVLTACAAFLSLIIKEIGHEAFMRCTVLQILATSCEMREFNKKENKESSDV